MKLIALLFSKRLLCLLMVLCFVGGCDMRTGLGRKTDLEFDLNHAIPHYGGCSHCGDKWNWKESKSVYYDETSGMFPLCRECFDKMTYDYVLWYHLKQFEKWDRQPTDEQLERLSWEISKEKQDSMWAVSWIKEKMYKNGKLIKITEIEP